ncbi:SAM-dependent methyltransferase [Allokutzneria sp. NRRL B-24872]|uniref:SAM-dependent methyltransferase n=1 Tax=Allokutzneria sp. NRRL B-24872 TaxID=1137961 RepID=UPI000A387F7C|nr:SAM-dependent methyltransferase [Allokutzneria sp. NRRL B-24872]
MATTDPAVVETALGPTVIAAVEQHEPIPLLADPFARHMLPRSGRFLVRLSRWSLLRRALVRASERRAPGIWANVLCRKRFIGDVLARAGGEGVESVVVLGAGLDTLVLRAALPPGVRVYEVDLPEIVHRKRALLVSVPGPATSHSTLVPADLHAENLADVLAAHEYRADTRTVFVWEAVTQYLNEGAVRATLECLRSAPSGSHLVFTYVRRDFLDGERLYGAERLHRRLCGQKGLWRFGLRPKNVRSLLAGYGWREVEQMGAEQFHERYLRPTGRKLTVSEVERSVHATR